MRHSNKRSNHRLIKQPKVAESWSSTARTNTIILIMGMAVMGWFSVKDLGLMFTSSTWKPTPAIIIQSKVNRGNRGGPDSPWVEFSYQINGQMYVSDELDFGQWSYDVPLYLSNYPIGKSVTAYYDPDNPKQAVLNKSGSVMANLFLCLLTWGAAVITFYYRFIKREK
jgi:hypothetical protein